MTDTPTEEMTTCAREGCENTFLARPEGHKGRGFTMCPEHRAAKPKPKRKRAQRAPQQQRRNGTPDQFGLNAEIERLQLRLDALKTARDILRGS